MPDDPAVQKVRFEPVHFEREYKGPRRKFRARGWLSAGPGTDLIWTHYGIYVMKELGRPKQIWAAESHDGVYDAPHYDIHGMNFFRVVFEDADLSQYPAPDSGRR